jgi:hypothetical protein
MIQEEDWRVYENPDLTKLLTLLATKYYKIVYSTL